MDRGDRRHRLRLALAALLVAMAAVATWLLLDEARQPPPRRAPDESTLSATAHEMVVADLVRPGPGNDVVLVLRERGRGRFLLLTIGEAEARAIALQLAGTAPPRPLTHDLLARSLGELGAEVVRVVVVDLRDNTYYARVVLRASGRELEIDSRPSDAVALALRTQAPIYAEAAVLDRAAMSTEEVF